MNNIKFDWNDITLVPSVFSTLNSRKEIDIYQNGKLPLFIAPMDTVIDKYNISTFLELGFEVCVPRGIPNNCSDAFTSFGLEEIEKLVNENSALPQKVLIDIANGHSIRLFNVSKKIKELYSNVILMVGNIANPLTFEQYAKIGVDYIRCGIGGGCFPEHSKVFTKKGIKTLRDINIGDFVITHKNRYRKVLEKHFYNKDEKFIKINNLPMCTPSHEYYIFSKNSETYSFVPADLLDPELHELVNINNGNLEHHHITEITTADYKGLVIDLTIEEDESYNIEGYIVHNSACTTSANSSVFYAYGSLIKECAEIKEKGNYNINIIADGGFKSYKDIIMALAVGADGCMVGSIPNKSLEACGETYMFANDMYLAIDKEGAIELYKDGGSIYHLYRGMSTKAVQKSWGKKGSELRTAEGISMYNKVEYTMSGWVENFSDYLKSAMSYTNKRNIKEFIGNVEYIYITQNAYERFNK